ncbi:MAG: apolipoprotein N-acyltransferase [Gemmatimonadaceae bacterium]|jgi:apolipoprotein N-acyltransferase
MAVAASAALFAIAFPPFKLLLPAFVCLAPLGIHIARLADRNGTGLESARAGLWFTLLGYGCNIYWIAVALSLFTNLAFAGYGAALVWLAPFGALTAAVLFTARRHTGWPMAVLLPLVWVSFELVLNYLSDLSFPWLPLGLTLSGWPVLAQAADLSGVRGLSFWIAATNGLVVDAWLAWRAAPLTARWRPVVLRAGVALGLVLTFVSYGAWRMSAIELTPFARVTVVQPNIPEEDKLRAADKDKYLGIAGRITREELARARTDLVIWPETAVPDFLWRNPHWTDSLRATVGSSGTPILFGFLDSTRPVPAGFEYYNAAALTDAQGNISDQAPYRKSFLVPIVERVPFVNPAWFASFNYFGSFGRGVDPVPFTLPFGKVGVLICYESIFPQLSRSYRRDGVSLLVNVTNDAWFGRSTAPYQHFGHLPIRAIENRLPIARSANTGISAYIDPLGRVHGATPLQVEGAWTHNVERASVTSLYSRFGDWLSWLSAAVVVALLGLGMARSRDPRGGAPST